MPSGVPIRIFAAFSKTDKYRKPNSGMFDLVRSLYREKGYEIDMTKSVYVGDAAGRLAMGGRRKDHGDTDYKLALNVGLKFVTPEVRPKTLSTSLMRPLQRLSSSIMTSTTRKEGFTGLTGQEHFLSLPRPKFPEPPNGFHPSKINLNRTSLTPRYRADTSSVPHVVPSNTPIAHKEVELVLFVGPP